MHARWLACALLVALLVLALADTCSAGRSSESRHSRHSSNSRDSADEDTQAESAAPPTTNQGQQYYSQYYNPKPSTPGHSAGGQGSGFDYSQYYSPAGNASPAPARHGRHHDRDREDADAEGGASSTVRSGAEGSSSNIRASGEMARGFMPGQHEERRAAAVSVLAEHAQRVPSQLQASRLHLANVAETDLAQRSAHHATRSEIDEHRRRMESERAHADDESTPRGAQSGGGQQPQQDPKEAAKWQEVGRRYANAYAPVGAQPARPEGDQAVDPSAEESASSRRHSRDTPRPAEVFVAADRKDRAVAASTNDTSQAHVVEKRKYEPPHSSELSPAQKEQAAKDDAELKKDSESGSDEDVSREGNIKPSSHGGPAVISSRREEDTPQPAQEQDPGSLPPQSTATTTTGNATTDAAPVKEGDEPSRDGGDKENDATAASKEKDAGDDEKVPSEFEVETLAEKKHSRRAPQGDMHGNTPNENAPSEPMPSEDDHEHARARAAEHNQRMAQKIREHQKEISGEEAPEGKHHHKEKNKHDHAVKRAGKDDLVDAEAVQEAPVEADASLLVDKDEKKPGRAPQGDLHGNSPNQNAPSEPLDTSKDYPRAHSARHYQRMAQKIRYHQPEISGEIPPQAKHHHKEKNRHDHAVKKNDLAEISEEEDSYTIANAQRPASFVDPEAAEPVQSQSDQETAPQGTSGGMSFFKWLLILVGLGVLGTSGYLVWQQKKHNVEYERIPFAHV